MSEINWRSKVSDKHLYTKDESLKDKDVKDIEDAKLIIKLGGINELANLRGFDSVEYDIVKAELDHVVMQCRIKWIEKEVDGIKLPAQTYCSTAGASRENSDPFWHDLLETCAENRAFTRAVRKYLGVNIVGEEEIQKAKKAPTVAVGSPNPQSTLLKVMANKGIDDLDALKAVLRGHFKTGKFDDTFIESIKGWEAVSDIKPKECKVLIGILQS